MLGVLAPTSATLAILLVILCVAALIDLRTGLIPNALTFGATAFALMGWLVAPPLEIAPVAAALAAAGLLWVLRAGSAQWLGVPGFGLGDIKLAIPMGVVLGWPVIWSLYLAVVLAAIVGILGLVTGRLTRRSRLPFAPFMLGGVLLRFVLPFERVLDWLAALPV
ncbi:MAG: prepilin peptidase [Bacteroidota bacterium]